MKTRKILAYLIAATVIVGIASPAAAEECRWPREQVRVPVCNTDTTTNPEFPGDFWDWLHDNAQGGA